MKTAVIVDFDTRRVLFQKIVESLRLLPSMEDWDLNWGEPFLAVSRNRRVWVRIFYDESAPPAIEKLKHEVERLKPHLLSDGELSLCFPQSWGINAQDLLGEASVRIWHYSHSGNNWIAAHEAVRGPMITSSPVFEIKPLNVALSQKMSVEQRLNPDEVRELAEMGLALKRLNLKRVSWF